MGTSVAHEPQDTDHGDRQDGDQDQDPRAVVPMAAVGAAEEVPTENGQGCSRHHEDETCSPATF